MYHRKNQQYPTLSHEPHDCAWDEQAFWPSEGFGERPEIRPVIEGQEIIIAYVTDATRIFQHCRAYRICNVLVFLTIRPIVEEVNSHG